MTAWVTALMVLALVGAEPVVPVPAHLVRAASAVPVSSPANPVSDDAVTDIARQLRCVVCQNLSVADSPSEMARQMRDLIREQLAAGRTPAEVTQYFVARYGEWVLLAPRLRGFNLVLWGLPFVGLVGGLGLALAAARRWSRRGTPEPVPEESADPADQERVRAELERFRD
jgi:cytochrome c-type biogenesis protein CcmH